MIFPDFKCSRIFDDDIDTVLRVFKLIEDTPILYLVPIFFNVSISPFRFFPNLKSFPTNTCFRDKFLKSIFSINSSGCNSLKFLSNFRFIKLSMPCLRSVSIF